jgi:hypothetical protein
MTNARSQIPPVKLSTCVRDISARDRPRLPMCVCRQAWRYAIADARTRAGKLPVAPRQA